MKHDEVTLTDLAADLRLSFDRSFALAPVEVESQTERFLAIEVGDHDYALRLKEIGGLFADRKVVPLPSRSPDLLGIASFRGVVVPVYDLRIIMGYPTNVNPRWLVLVAPDNSIALAFDHLDGYFDLPLDAIAREVGKEHAGRYVFESIRASERVRSVIGTAAILDMIKRRE